MYPAFENIVLSTCPTLDMNGNELPYQIDRCNKAFMEVDLLSDLDLL